MKENKNLSEDMTKVLPFVRWWTDNYKYVSDREEWCISTSLFVDGKSNIEGPSKINQVESYHNVYIICPLKYSHSKPYAYARKLAKNWGWIFNKFNHVVDFDMKKFNKIKHQIPIKELGLL